MTGAGTVFSSSSMPTIGRAPTKGFVYWSTGFVTHTQHGRCQSRETEEKRHPTWGKEGKVTSSPSRGETFWVASRLLTKEERDMREQENVIFNIALQEECNPSCSHATSDGFLLQGGGWFYWGASCWVLGRTMSCPDYIGPDLLVLLFPPSSVERVVCRSSELAIWRFSWRVLLFLSSTRGSRGRGVPRTNAEECLCVEITP